MWDNWKNSKDMESSRLDPCEERIMPFRVVDQESGKVIFECEEIQPLFDHIDANKPWKPKEIYVTTNEDLHEH
jgi:hypothetical protein